MFEDLMIGGLSGVVSRTLTAPLELLKIQGQNSFVPNANFSDTIRKEGVRGLWKGNLVNSVRIFPQMAINFTTYEFFKTRVFPKYLPSELQNATHFLSGAMGGFTSMLAVYPLETIRSRLSLQSSNSHYNGLLDALRKTSIREMYYGLGMSLMGYMPYTALSFGFYNMFKNMVETYNKKSGRTEQPYDKLICGGLSGVSSVSFTFPTDLIRRRLQLQGFDPSVPKYDGILDCIKKIGKTEGIKGYYRGIIPCYIKIFPAVAIQFAVMEQLKVFQRYMERA